jgi:excisionase family DNA binding protein
VRETGLSPKGLTGRRRQVVPLKAGSFLCPWQKKDFQKKGILMRQFRDDVLKIEEISKWLRIPKSTIYKLCLEGQIPGKKIGRHWRFIREDIESWLRNRIKKENK